MLNCGMTTKATVDQRERVELVRELQEAEARAAAGEAVDYDPKTFKQRLIDIYRASDRCA